MQALHRALDQIASTPGCALEPPAGLPVLPTGYQLPDDLKAFYVVAGGATLYRGADFQFNVLAPSGVVPTNLRLIGNAKAGDISDQWFTVADDSNGEYLSIDLGVAHHGRCYDSFHETHALVGSTAVIATSFTDLLFRLLANGGAHPYWLAKGFLSLGDAYDGSSEA
jgi:antitoxin YokJ